MKVVVVGAGGQLGAAVAREFSDVSDVVTLTRAHLDVTNDRDVAATMARLRPDAIINGAAFNDVDGAEERPVEALNVNAFAVRSLARAAADLDAILVHYSSDFVFDGTASQPYTEQDRPNPRSVYAASKLLGEWFAADAPKAYVLRVESLFGRSPDGGAGRGSVAGIFNALRSGGEARVFDDRTVSPTSVIDGAWATRRILETGAPFGLYHVVNSGRCTWLEFARELAARAGFEPRLVPTRMAEMTLRAQRPQYSVLSNEKLRSVGIAMPTWQDALGRFLRP